MIKKLIIFSSSFTVYLLRDKYSFKYRMLCILHCVELLFRTPQPALSSCSCVCQKDTVLPATVISAEQL